MIEAKIDIILNDGQHQYWSTHCRHDRHEDCAAVELAPGVPRSPAQCKTCGTPCVCQCHRQGEGMNWTREDFERDRDRYQRDLDELLAHGMTDDHPLVKRARRRIETVDRVLTDPHVEWTEEVTDGPADNPA